MEVIKLENGTSVKSGMFRGSCTLAEFKDIQSADGEAWENVTEANSDCHGDCYVNGNGDVLFVNRDNLEETVEEE